MSSLFLAFRTAASTTTTPLTATLSSECCKRGFFFRHGGSSDVTIPATNQHGTFPVAHRPYSTVLSSANRSLHGLNFACRGHDIDDSANAPATCGFRAMGGGPPNRKVYFRLKRKQAKKAKEQAKEHELMKDLVRIDPQDVPPVPESIQPHHMEAIEKYVAGEWFAKFKLGAGTDRLRRDIAFRMGKGGPSPKEKLPTEVVKSIAGELARRGTVRLRPRKKGVKEGWVILPPATVSPDGDEDNE